MKRWHAASWLLAFVLLGGGGGTVLSQQAAAGKALSVSMVVSVEALRGDSIPDIARHDVKVFQENEPMQVTGWAPLKDDQAGLELFILVDDSVDSTIDLQLKDVRGFISAQPATTAVAVGYTQGGVVDTVQEFTRDHSRAANALRSPKGSVSGNLNPYQAITDLIDRWHAGPQRREILLISDGINPLHAGPNDSSLDSAIAGAQRAGIQIYCVLAPVTGHLGHSMRLNSLAQLKLSELADETGGELYMQAFAFQMDKLAERFAHQYRVTFRAKPREEAGFESVRLEAQTPNAELVAATKVYIPVAK